MTISAQVIDTIVEWIDDNLNQPLRIDDIARHAGYSKWHLQRLFLQYKGESLGRYIRERKLLLAARICVSPTKKCMTFVCATGLILNRPLPVFSPARLTSRRAPTAKKITVGHTDLPEKHFLWQNIPSLWIKNISEGHEGYLPIMGDLR